VQNFFIFAQMNVQMEQLLIKSDNLVRRTPMGFRRQAMPVINWSIRLLGIKGARGTGKTTLLLQRLRELGLPANQAAYFSLDDLYFTNHELAPTLEQFYRQGGEYIFLDEVHKYPGWAREIKNLYDFYPQLNIAFTGSSIIDLAREEVDLSRRALLHELPGLSYREFLIFNEYFQAPALTLGDILNPKASWRDSLPADFRPLEQFRNYLAYGYYPFSKEDKDGYHMRLQQLIRQVVEYDMAELQGFDPRNARKLLQLLFVLSANVPYKPNLTKLAQEADIHRNTVLNYLIYLEQARLIRLVQVPGAGLGLLRKPEKVYLNNTNLAYALHSAEPNVGNLRETFFLSQLQPLHHISAPPNGDFLIDDQWTIEIGGAGKTFAQIAAQSNAFVVRDALEYPIGNILPLWVFGMLY